MKITILYFSQSGNTERAAEMIKEGAESAGDVEVRLMNLAAGDGAVDGDFLSESAAVIVGTPTYMANMAWQLKKWLDTDKTRLAGKLGAAFATANFAHGGPDIAVLGILQHLLVKGMLIYSSGTGCGKPIIHLGPVAIAGELDKSRDLFVLFGKRIAEKALELFG